MKKKVTLIGPAPRNCHEDESVKRTVEYQYDAITLAYFSDKFMIDIINGVTEIDLSQDCRPEEFHAFNVLLRDSPENRYDYIVEAIELLLKTGYKF
jgi:hypothetical protein